MEGTYGIISLIPIIAIVVLALITKQTFISIFVGLWWVCDLAGGNPLETFNLFLTGCTRY